MPRQPRIQVEGGLYHIYARGNRQEPIYMGDDDRTAYLRLFRAATGRFCWHCLAYCLMTNHLHLVLETPRPTLSTGLQWIHGAYGRWFNERHGLTGHVFEGRFGSEFVRRGEHLLELGRYLALNPVRAGLVQRPEAWPWSSYAATVGFCRPEPFLDAERLLRAFTDDVGMARARFQASVSDAG